MSILYLCLSTAKYSPFCLISCVSTSSWSSLHFSFLSLCNSLNLSFFIEFFWATSSCANSAVPCQDSHLCLSVSFLLFFLILFDPSLYLFLLLGCSAVSPLSSCWKNAFLPSCPLFILHNSSKLHKSYCINILSLQLQCSNAIVVAFLLSIWSLEFSISTRQLKFIYLCLNFCTCSLLDLSKSYMNSVSLWNLCEFQTMSVRLLSVSVFS